MALPGTPGDNTPISMSQIATELGISATNRGLWADLEQAVLNDCSSNAPSQTQPSTLDEWKGYDHSALPPNSTPKVSMTGSGIPAGQADNWLRISGSDLTSTCATNIELHSATTEFGTYTRLVTTSSDAWVNGISDIGLGAETTRWYKMRSLGTVSTATGSFSSAVAGKTGPTTPKNFSYLSETVNDPPEPSDDYDIAFTWNNGTSPGIRNMEPMEIKYRLRTGAFTGTTQSLAGSTSFSYKIVGQGVNNNDPVTMSIRYVTETATASFSYLASVPE